MVEIPRRRLRFCITLLITMTLIAGSPAIARSQGLGAEYDLAPEDHLERALAPFAKARSYRHRCVFTSTLVDPNTPDSHFDLVGAPPDGTATTLAVVKPDKLYFDDGTTVCVTDGVLMWVVNRELGEYTEQLLNPEREPHQAFSWACPGFPFNHDDVLEDLFPEGPIESPCSSWGESTRSLSARAEDLDGKPGVRIRWDDIGSAAFSSLWVDRHTGLIGERRSRNASLVRVEPGDAVAAGDPGEWEERVSSRVTAARYHDVEFNGEIPDDFFVFRPGPDDRLVESIGGRVFKQELPLEPTLTLADGSLDEVSPERLRRSSGTRISDFGTTRSMHRIDLDGSGRGDRSVLIVDQTLRIVSADGTAVGRVQLRTDGFRGFVQDVVAVAIGGETHWFAGLGDRSNEWRGAKMWSLFRSDGEEVWRYVPELRPGQVAEAELAAGDLDGDALPEFVLGIRFSVAERGGEGWMYSPDSSLLVVLDVSGHRLVQRVLADRIELVRVLAPKITGARPQLLALIDDPRSSSSRLELLELGGPS